MSVITTASPSRSLKHSDQPSAAKRGGWIEAIRRGVQRRRHVPAQRAYGQQDLTDAYIDRHGTAQVDAAVLAAFKQR